MSVFINRLLNAPRNQLKAVAFGGFIAAQALTGTAVAHAADTPAKDAIVQLASAEVPGKTPATATKVSAQQLLRLAESQVGISEDSEGGGTKFHQWYMDSPRAEQTVVRDGGSIAGFKNASWCDMFVSWVGHKAGLQKSIGSDAYTVEHAKWFAAQNRWGVTPTPGAVVFFDWHDSGEMDGIDHVGFVVKDNGDGTIKTIEGNTGNGKVEIRTRPTEHVTGYGYPGYAG